MSAKSLKRSAILYTIRQCCSVIFPLITFPYVSRVLQAENYGKVNFGNSIVSYFLLIAALGISNYAIREGAARRNNQKELQNFSNQVFTINVITTVFSYGLLIILLLSWPKLYGYRIIILVQSLSIFFTTLGIDWLYSINEDYLYITIRSIIIQFTSLIMLFIFVHDKNDYILYALISVIAGAGASIFNFLHAKKYVRISLTKHPNFRQHLLPMLILFCNTIAITIYVNSDITILGVLKGDYYVGIYSVAVKVYTIAQQILNAIMVITLPRLSFYLSDNRLDDYNRLLTKISKFLIVIILPAIVGLFMLSKEIVLIIAGSEYSQGYIALRILSFALGFSVFASFFTTAVLLPNKKEKLILKSTIISAVANLGLNFVFIPIMYQNGSALTTVIAEFLVFMASIHFAKGNYKILKLQDTIIPCIIGCFFIIIACLMVQHFFSNAFVVVVIAVILSVLLYGITLVAFKNEIVMSMLGTRYNVFRKFK